MSIDDSAVNNSSSMNCTSQYGMIVVLKRDGRDSASFELTDLEYTFGRASNCDIRIQLASIGDMHCRLRRNANGQVSSIKSKLKN